MTRQSRSLFLASLALLAAGSALAQARPESIPAKAPAYRSLPVVSSQGGVLTRDLTLAMTNGEIGGDRVRLRAYNGKLIGDTWTVRPGDTLRVHLKNNLPCPPGQSCKCLPPPKAGQEAPGHVHAVGGAPPAAVFNHTNLHTHGLHVSPSGNSDNVFLDILPTCDFGFEFQIPADHPAGTFWYHPHVHGSTAVQVSSGAEGALIVKGAFDEVPGIKGAKDEVLLFQQIPYKCNFADPNDWKCGPDQIGLVEDFGQQFGPGKWDKSGRFTTVNGVVQPRITLRPGEVQRWRLIHGGVRENLAVAVGRKTGPDTFEVLDKQLNLIALDGLPIGDVEARKVVFLAPGYRADVMIKAPSTAGTYYLLDEPSVPLLTALTPAASLEAVPPQEPRKVLAEIVVSGTPCSDPARPCHAGLPSPAALKPFRLKSVTDAEIGYRPKQQVFFDINVNQSPPKFLVCGREFTSGMEPRKLELGKADEWIVAASNIAGHPFHIHVNPFEMLDEATGKWYWKDTLFVQKGTKVRLRTRYEKFDGDFVLHCHILDHEDEGMMESVRIAKGPQPVFNCPIP
jgi:FtsP/CotA-like multicopper oxidase with cupredoxin domain